MYKKIALFFFVMSLAVTFLTLGTLKAEAKPIKLTYSNFFPPTHIQSKLAEAWCKEVEKRTNGQVYVEYYPGGTLTKAAQCYDGVVTGLSDVGLSCLAYTRGRFPVMAAVDLPLGYTSGMVATKVVNEVYKKFMPKELMDTRVMYLHAHGPGLPHTRDKAVKTLEDTKGLKMRATGTSGKVAAALGATPVSMPMPETYQSLQKGVVDGSLYPWEANKGWKLGEVCHYCTAAFSSAYTTAFFVVMNKGKWDSIPADLQQIINEINAEWIVKHGDAWDASDREGIGYFLNQGGTVFGIDKREAEKWRAAVAPMLEEYVADMKKKGFANAQEIVDFTVSTLEEHQK
jgi:TRAP-type C4-dicarboxylate transport system substrate-binding protein